MRARQFCAPLCPCDESSSAGSGSGSGSDSDSSSESGSGSDSDSSSESASGSGSGSESSGSRNCDIGTVCLFDVSTLSVEGCPSNPEFISRDLEPGEFYAITMQQISGACEWEGTGYIRQRFEQIGPFGAVDTPFDARVYYSETRSRWEMVWVVCGFYYVFWQEGSDDLTTTFGLNWNFDARYNEALTEALDSGTACGGLGLAVSEYLPRLCPCGPDVSSSSESSSSASESESESSSASESASESSASESASASESSSESGSSSDSGSLSDSSSSSESSSGSDGSSGPNCDHLPEVVDCSVDNHLGITFPLYRSGCTYTGSAGGGPSDFATWTATLTYDGSSWTLIYSAVGNPDFTTEDCSGSGSRASLFGFYGIANCETPERNQNMNIE